MTKKSKLEEFGLMDEARKLRDEGYGYEAIPKILMEKHPEYTLSHMAIKRGLESGQRNDIRRMVTEGKNPIDELVTEIREKARKIDNKLEKLADVSQKILDDAMKVDNVGDRTKAVKELRETLVQIQKNQLLIHQFCDSLQHSVSDESLHQREQVNILLIKWTNVVEENLCPSCRQKTIPRIMELVESEGVEKEEKNG